MSADTFLSRRIIVMLSGERDSRSEARSESKHPYTKPQCRGMDIPREWSKVCWPIKGYDAAIQAGPI